MANHTTSINELEEASSIDKDDLQLVMRAQYSSTGGDLVIYVINVVDHYYLPVVARRSVRTRLWQR
jgi:hypothetical protein